MKSIFLSLLLSIAVLDSFSQFYQRQVITEDVNSFFNDIGTRTKIDNNTLILSNYRHDIVYLYELEDDIWELKQTLAPSDPTGDKNFGIIIDIDGDDLVISANKDDDNQGAIYLFHKGTDGIWVETTKIPTPLPRSSFSSPYWGGALVTLRNGRVTTGRNNGINRSFQLSTQNEDFTWDLNSTISAPGQISGGGKFITDSILVVRARNGVSLFVFNLQPNGEWADGGNIIPSETDGIENFGFTISGEGNRIIVNSFKDDLYLENDTIVDAGSVFVFEKIDSLWVNTGRLISPEPATGDLFGISVALENNIIVVGSSGHDFGIGGTDSIPNAGAVFVFENINDEWVSTQKLVTQERILNHDFGQVISINNETISIGADERIYLFHKGNDCLNIANGEAYYDICSFCVGGTSGYLQNTSLSSCILTGTEDLHLTNLTITPNPFNNAGIQIESLKNIDYITLYDASGELSTEGTIDTINRSMTDLKTGIYLMHILFEDGSIEVEKLVKQ